MKMNDAPTKDEAKQVAAFQFLVREMASTVDEMGAKLLVVFIPTNYEPPPAALVKTITDLRLPFIDDGEFRLNQVIELATLLSTPFTS